MKEYFLHDGQNQDGPFSIAQLKEKGITSETYVWKEGLSDWVKAGDIKEINDVLSVTPPPFIKPNNPGKNIPREEYTYSTGVEKTGRFIGRNLKVALFITLIVLIAGYSYYKINMAAPADDLYATPPPAREKTPEELRLELVQKERQNPSDYIHGKLTMRENLLGETVFEGTLTNSASVAVFKDIKVKFNFLSKTGTTLESKLFTIYEIIKPQQTIQLKKIKTYSPSDTDGFSYTIEDATPTE